MLCTCKFCSTEFESRAQTKNPTACPNPLCQLARQRKNENDWHVRNKELYRQSAEYHRQQRIARFKVIHDIVIKMLEAIETGFKFMAMNINTDLFNYLFQNFMHDIGVRKNKQVLLW